MNIPLIINIPEPEPEQTTQPPAENTDLTQHTPENGDLMNGIIIAIITAMAVGYFIK